MKMLRFALLLSLGIGAVPLAAPALTLAPTPTPAASPVPDVQPAPGGMCPDCPMGKSSNGGTNQGGKTAARQTETETERAVIDLEIKWCEAEAQHDVAFLEKIEAEGFVFTDFTGTLTTKQDEIAEARKGGDKIEYKLSDMKAHVYGDAVVLTGQTTFDLASAASAPTAYRWTDVFVRQSNGEWQVVASQTTTLGQGKEGAEGSGE